MFWKKKEISINAQFGEDFDYHSCLQQIRQKYYGCSKKGKGYVQIKRSGAEILFGNHLIGGLYYPPISYHTSTNLKLIINDDQSFSFYGSGPYEEIRRGSSVSFGCPDIQTVRMYTKKEFEKNLENKHFKDTMKTFKKKTPTLHKLIQSMLPEENTSTEHLSRSDLAHYMNSLPSTSTKR